MKKPFQLKKFSLIGLDVLELYRLRDEGHLNFQEAKLIPTYKVGDELGLSSIFLSSLRLVKEFRETILASVNLRRSRTMLYLTEFYFTDSSLKENRLDGIVLSLTKGKIKDAAVFEFKAKKSQIESRQIERYLDLTSTYLKLSKFVTVSEEQTSDPTLLPYKLSKTPRRVSVYHLSWSYIKTQAHLLLQESGEDSIEDIDQVHIMSEVLDYLESDTLGLTNFDRMGKGWKDLVKGVKSGLKPTNELITEAAGDWYQEQNDIALKLSKKLGLLVSTNLSRGSKAYEKQITSYSNQILKKHELSFHLRVKDVNSDITVSANLFSEVQTVSYTITPPLDKGNKAKCTWLIKQFEKSQKKAPDGFKHREEEIQIAIGLKYMSTDIIIPFKDIYTLADVVPNDKEITEFSLLLSNQLGATFKSPVKFVTELEDLVFDHYSLFVENFKTWVPPAPKMKEE